MRYPSAVQDCKPRASGDDPDSIMNHIDIDP